MVKPMSLMEDNTQKKDLGRIRPQNWCVPCEMKESYWTCLMIFTFPLFRLFWQHIPIYLTYWVMYFLKCLISFSTTFYIMGSWERKSIKSSQFQTFTWFKREEHKPSTINCMNNVPILYKYYFSKMFHKIGLLIVSKSQKSWLLQPELLSSQK